MTGLGLRYCPQHPESPLMLARNGRFWYCEEAECAHTESSTAYGNGKATGLTGRAIPRKGSERGLRFGTSTVERDAIANVDEATPRPAEGSARGLPSNK